MQYDLKPQIYYVLHRKPYRENSQLLDLFCEKQGRFSAIYRINKKNPQLQPFIPYRMQFSGRGDLQYCQHVEAHYSHISKSGNLRGVALKGRNLYCGFYLNELLVRLTWKDEPQVEIFQIYQQTLTGLLLLENDQQAEPFLRRFEFHLLSILGYQYNWRQDSECRDIVPGKQYYFDPNAGFKNLDEDQEARRYAISKDAMFGFPGDALLAIAADDWSHKMSWQVAKKIARLALEPLLGGKPLASRALFQRL